MYFLKEKKNKGFVILFAVTLSAMLLAIALGVSNIALKELNFSTSARDANDAFFAADTGVECALINDKSTSNVFLQSGGPLTMSCLNRTITFTSLSPSWNFILSGLGSTGQGCANVTVTKDFTTYAVKIVSKGYNNGGGTVDSCTPSGTSSLERELDVNY